MRRFLIILLVFCGVSAPAFATTLDKTDKLPTTIGAGQALEGDLITVNGATIKLWGIDAPDNGQACYDRMGKEYDCFQQAKLHLSQLIGKNQVECHIRGKESKGQQIGTCGVQGLDLAALMVRDGWASAFHGLCPQYARLEGTAQSKKRGLWSGRAESPWLWRTEQLLKKKR